MLNEFEPSLGLPRFFNEILVLVFFFHSTFNVGRSMFIFLVHPDEPVKAVKIEM